MCSFALNKFLRNDRLWIYFDIIKSFFFALITKYNFIESISRLPRKYALVNCEGPYNWSTALLVLYDIAYCYEMYVLLLDWLFKIILNDKTKFRIYFPYIVVLRHAPLYILIMHKSVFTKHFKLNILLTAECKQSSDGTLRMVETAS